MKKSLFSRTASFFFTWQYPTFLVLTALASCYPSIGLNSRNTCVAEYCNESGRKYTYMSQWVFWVFGMTLIPFLVLTYPLLLKSPRLLFSQKKFKSAAKVIATIRKINKDEEVNNLEEVLKHMNDKVENKTELGVTSLFKEASLRRLVVSMAILYTVNDYIYFGAQINAGNLAGNMFVNFSLLALTELPSPFVGQFMMDRFGRRWSHVICMVLTTVCFTGCILFVNMDHMDKAVVALSLAAKTTSNVSWYIMYVQHIEVYPTLLRNSGIFLSLFVNIIVNMTTPFAVSLDSVDKCLPYVVFVFMSVLGIIVASLVPETKGMPLPETIADVDKLFSEMRFFELSPWKRIAKQENNVEL